MITLGKRPPDNRPPGRTPPPKPPPPPPIPPITPPSPPPARPRPGNPMSLLRAYARAYVDCHRWLVRHCPPYDWVLGMYLLPGSSMYRLCRDRGTS